MVVENKSFMKSKNYTKFKFQFPEIKFYQDIAMLICLPIVSSCFSTMMAALSSQNRYYRTHTANNIYYLALGKVCPSLI